MDPEPLDEDLAAKMWRTYMLTGDIIPEAEYHWFESRRLRPVVKRLPKDPRCKICHYPFQGLGGRFARRVLNVKPSKLNPNLCNICEQSAQRFQGGAEIEATIIFADVRGSTTLAEAISPAAFGKLINRFYQVASRALFKHNGLVEKLIGDEVTAFFVPGFSGAQHARDALKAAEEILAATGHRDPDGPWIPVGVGINTGVAFVGAVTTDEGHADITVLGDNANIAARLTALAQAGEVVISESAVANAGIDGEELEKRRLALKGRSEPVDVRVLKVGPAP